MDEDGFVAFGREGFAGEKFSGAKSSSEREKKMVREDYSKVTRIGNEKCDGVIIK